MVEMFPLRSADAAYSKISGMLSTLGDPFTRIISPKEYQSFRIGSDGNLQGAGVFINRVPGSGRLTAFREAQQIEQEYMKAMRLTGNDNERGGRIRQKESSSNALTTRELFPMKTVIRSDDGHECKTGYVRLAAFSQTAAVEMENAVKRMEDQGVQSYILDLRNNPGGLVKAGLDVAQIWLDGNETLVNTIDREGNVLPINMIQGHSLTHDPLVVLVNEGSASASEILAGALHDNGRAILVGHRTFGKGKIQSVTELDDGSALFITVAKYLSPALHEIDQVGIQPDIQCSPDILSLPRAPSLRENSEATSLEMDSCIMVAEQALEIEQTKGSAS